MELKKAREVLKKSQELFPKQDFKIIPVLGGYAVQQFVDLEKQKAKFKAGKLNCYRNSEGKVFMYEYKGREIEKLGGFIMCVHWNVYEAGKFIFYTFTRKEAIEIIDRLAKVGIFHLPECVNYQFQLESAYV